MSAPNQDGNPPKKKGIRKKDREEGALGKKRLIQPPLKPHTEKSPQFDWPDLHGPIEDEAQLEMIASRRFLREHPEIEERIIKAKLRAHERWLEKQKKDSGSSKQG